MYSRDRVERLLNGPMYGRLRKDSSYDLAATRIVGMMIGDPDRKCMS